MKKTILLVFFLSPGLFVQAQDWLSWSFQYDFKIESNKRGNYQYDSIEVSINEPFNSTRLQSSSLALNDSTSTYSLNLNYGCVSCGFDDMHHPTSVYLKVHLFDTFLKQNISIIIPITFDTIKEPDLFQKKDPVTQLVISNGPIYFDLNTIIYEDFILFNTTFNKYDGIRVKSDGDIYKYMQGEYLFPKPEKLTRIKAANTV